MTYEEWEAAVDEEIKRDSLWKVMAYRLALSMCDLGWRDTARLVQNRRLWGLSDQLYRALGSVSANPAEGYSRGTGKDRARFYEYALGSARESRDWYFKALHVLGEEIYQHRLHLLTRIIQLLLTMVPQQRGRILREPPAAYATSLTNDAELRTLLHIVPLPDTVDA